MKAGDIILIPFPFSELHNVKVRPAVVIGLTKDGYGDVIVSAISSVVSKNLTKSEMLLKPKRMNNLRVKSVVKVDRIATLKHETVIAELGKLNEKEFEQFKRIFNSLIEEF
jgi:mRNA interferase MazF